jgi:hypothetical protein
MDQWLHLRSKYLDILLEMEGHPTMPKCSMCGMHADIKCPDCYGSRLFCKACCVEAHRHSPFHRPLQWTTSHYTPVSLHSLGFMLFLGHDGVPCPLTVEVWSHQSSYLYSLTNINLGNPSFKSTQYKTWTCKLANYI